MVVNAEIETRYGRIRGSESGGVRSFRGVPYAAALIGSRRFLPPEPPVPWAVLVGPEGGLAAEELALLQALPAARLAHLGPRLLRADTAALAALALWQAWLGDWSTAAARTM